MRILRRIARAAVRIAIALFLVAGGFAIYRPSSGHTLPLLFAGTGVLLIVGSCLMLVIARQVRSRAEWLRKHGRLVTTKFQAVTTRRIKVDGRSPYCIITQWHDTSTGTYHSFVSGNIPFDPEPYISGRPIYVRIDPADPKRYVMDTSFLPEDDEGPAQGSAV